MKVGVREPSIKRSLGARTAGRVKMAVKRSINSLYRKKSHHSNMQKPAAGKPAENSETNTTGAVWKYIE